MSVLALDLGTTSWKAGIYGEDGCELAVRRIVMPARQDSEGNAFYAPDDLTSSLRSLILALPVEYRERIRYIALAGMAEAGVITDRETGEALSPILPWYDKRGLPIFEKLQKEPLLQDRYEKTGLPNSYKYSVYKLLALAKQTSRHSETLSWLGIVEYAAFILSGKTAAEPTLAARTYAFDIVKGAWDKEFLNALGFDETVFPPVVPSGSPMGIVKKEWAKDLHLPPDAKVCICGHDHICAAFGAHALESGRLFCSMGTAQVLLAMKNTSSISERDTMTGLSFGPAPLGGLTVLGSIQSAGGSITLMNRLLYGGSGFDSLMKEAETIQDGPGSILYFPYLNGSGAPHVSGSIRGGFLGLGTDTTRAGLLKAVYEGIAFESRLILESFGLSGIHGITACGGLNGHRKLMQIMADVLCLPVCVLEAEECTLYGAAGLACLNDGITLPKPAKKEVFAPRPKIAAAYESAYRNSYLPLSNFLFQHYDKEQS